MAANPFDPEAEDRRVYTDPRFPTLEVVNFGGTAFVVFELSPKSGRYEEIADFTTYGGNTASVLEETAARLAKNYFDDLERYEITPGAPERDALGMPKDRDVSDVVNAPARDFADEQVMTPDQVLDMWEKAQAMPDGPEKKALMAQVRAMSQQLESRQVVDLLLA